jgi:hypothetical protein
MMTSSSSSSSSFRGGGMQFFTVVFLLLHTPLVWTWTTTSPPSSRFTQQQQLQQQRASLFDQILPRKDGLTILHVSDGVDDESNYEQQSLRFRRRRRDDTTQLFASNNDDDDIVNGNYEEDLIQKINEEEKEEDEASLMVIADALTSPPPPQSANEVNEFVQKAEQAWTSPVNVVSKGMPLKGSISAGTTKTSEAFTKKAPFFSMEKKLSTPVDPTTFKKKTLPPLSLKSPGDGGITKKGLGLPPLPKKGLGGAFAKKGFPSSPMTLKGGATPLTMKGPMFKASTGDEGDSSTFSLNKSLPLKGGISMGEKQAAGLPGKGLPFMKKAPSFSMEKKTLPPLPLKGPGVGVGLKKGLGLPPLAKTSFGDGGAAVKKGFPAAPLPMKGAMPLKGGLDGAVGDDDGASTPDQGVEKDLPPKGLPLKGGILMGEKQAAGLPGKGMPFMKKAPSFSMEKQPSVAVIEDVDAINSNTNTDTTNNNASINSDEEAKYLALAKEAWTQFFSDQISEDEFVSMALDAWKDASSVKSQNDIGSQPIESQSDTPSAEAEVVESQQDVGVKEDNTIVAVTNLKQDDASPLDLEQDDERAQSDTPSVGVQEDDVVTATDKKQGGINGAFSFLSGFKSSLFPGSKKSSGTPTPVNGEMDRSIADENEEDVPYGLRMKSSSASVVLPPPSSSAVDESPTSERGGDDAYNNNVGTDKSLGEKKQVTPPLPINKGFAPPMKSKGEKQITPPLPITKGIVPPTNKGIMKGKENSLSGVNKLSSTPPPSLDKGGVKLGIQGKFAPKKLETATKKNWQGNRGGLSFLSSNKLSKEYKADTNYNKMNKGITVEKIKAFKVGQVGKAKADDATTTLREDVDKTDDAQAKSTAVDLPPATELMSDGITAEEAERIRLRRLQTEEEKALNPIVEPVQPEDTPMAATKALETASLVDRPTAITEGMTADEAERARMARLEVSDTMREALKASTEKKGEAGTLPPNELISTASDTWNVSKGMPLKGSISTGTEQPDKIDLKATKATPDKTDNSEAQSNDVYVSPATNLVTDGMTAEEAERIRMSRMQTEEERASKSMDEPVQSEDTPTAIAEGMTAEEAERARMTRYTTTIDVAKLQASTQQQQQTHSNKVSKVEDPPTPTAPPRPLSESMEAAELRQLKEKTALLETKIDKALSHIDNLEARVAVLDRENVQLRLENTELRKEFEELKRTMDGPKWLVEQ